MIKSILGFLVTAIVLIVAALYIAYGEIEPCKVLAIEKERRAHQDGAVVGTVEELTSSTSGMSSTECVSGLLDSWSDRLK